MELVRIHRVLNCPIFILLKLEIVHTRVCFQSQRSVSSSKLTETWFPSSPRQQILFFSACYGHVPSPPQGSVSRGLLEVD